MCSYMTAWLEMKKLPNSAGTHPLPPSTIPGGFKSSEEYAQVKLDYAPNKETVSKNKSE